MASRRSATAPLESTEPVLGGRAAVTMVVALMTQAGCGPPSAPSELELPGSAGAAASSSHPAPIASASPLETDPQDAAPVAVAVSASPDDATCGIHTPPPKPDHRIYATWQRFPLTATEHGIDGSLQVLEDSRFTRPGASRLGTHPIVPPCDALPTRVEVLDRSGAPQQHVSFLPQVDVAAPKLAPGQTVFRVRELVQCLASCWCGDRYSFWQVREGRLARLQTCHASGAVRAVQNVTAGCYEGTSIRRDGAGQLYLSIRRTVLIMPGAIQADERHFYDGAQWRASVVQRKIPW